MHQVVQIIRRNLVTAAPSESTLEVSRRMCDAQVGAIVILDGDALVGIFSERDLMRRVVVARRDPEATPVSAVMTREDHATGTDRLAERVTQRPVHTQEVLATVYRHLGIDARGAMLPDPVGSRPRPLLDDYSPIRELV